MGSLLEGKRLLVTGVLTDASIAFHVARLAQQEGARVVLSSYGRVLNLTTRISGRLPETAPVVQLDVTNTDDLAALPDRIREHVDGLDGVVHAIGFAPEAAFGGNFLNTGWDDVATAMHISAYSLKALTVAAQATDGSQAARLSGWTSTPRSRGRSTTGWVSRRLRSSRVRVISHAISDPDGIRVNLGVGGTAADDGGKEHSRFRRAVVDLGDPSSARVGRQ